MFVFTPNHSISLALINLDDHPTKSYSFYENNHPYNEKLKRIFILQVEVTWFPTTTMPNKNPT